MQSKQIELNLHNTLCIFGAEWCGSCKVLKSLLETSEYEHVPVQFIDADDNPEICKEHGIRSLPTAILFGENGYVLKRASGLEAVKFVNSLV